MAEAHAENRNFTRRERQVSILAAQGMGNRDMAAQLGVSEETLKRHLSNIYNKTGMGSRCELMAWMHARERAADKARIAQLEKQAEQIVWKRLAATLPSVFAAPTGDA